MTKRDFAYRYALTRFRRCFPTDVRDEMEAIVAQAMRIGNLTTDKPWNVVAAHLMALRLAKREMDAIEEHLTPNLAAHRPGKMQGEMTQRTKP
jgi:hypothetical protein